MKAQQLVNKLLGEGIDDVDPEAYVNTTTDPSQRLERALRDELVERGWRRIRVEKDGDLYHIHAGWIDGAWRAKCAAQGMRVTPGPPSDWPGGLFGRLQSSLRGAVMRVGGKVDSISVDDIHQAHDGIDLENPPEDFEDDPGDYSVYATLRITPRAKFWSKLSQASPPDPLPQPSQPPKSLLTPEEEDARAQAHREHMDKLRARGEAEWKDIIQSVRDASDMPDWLR